MPLAREAALRRRPWPGNVRELENVVMRACALSPGLTTLTLGDIQPTGLEPQGRLDLIDLESITLPDGGIRFEELERHLLIAAWEKSGHNQTRGAELLGLARQAFSYRLQKHGIIPKHARDATSDES